MESDNNTLQEESDNIVKIESSVDKRPDIRVGDSVLVCREGSATHYDTKILKVILVIFYIRISLENLLTLTSELPFISECLSLCLKEFITSDFKDQYRSI